MVASLCDRSGAKLVRAFQLVPAGRRSLAVLRFCIAAALISSATSLMAADNPAEGKTERSRPSLFRLPDILKRERQSAARHRPASPDRFVARTMQLLTEARNLEQSGAAADALELAQRAQSVLNTAERIAGARWPVNEESPAQYISAIKRRTGVTGKATPASAATTAAESVDRTPGLLPASPSVATVPSQLTGKPQAATGVETIPAAGATNRSTSKFASELPGNLPARTPARLQSQTAAGKLVLDWGNRTPASGITLTAGTQAPREQKTLPDDSGQSAPNDESGLLFQQLDQLETWTSIEPPVGSASELRPRSGHGHLPTTSSSKLTDQPQSGSQPPLIIPGLIDRPDGIADQNVEPIPTGLTDSVSGSSAAAVTTTIPVVPNASDRLPTINTRRTTSEESDNTAATSGDAGPTVYDQTPRLLTQTDAGASTRSTTESAGSESTIWQLAAAQLVSTFLGIILAIAAFLLLRAAASKLFGTRLGVTFEFGSGRSGAVSAHANSHEQSADVVPFNGQSARPELSASENQLNQPKRAGGVANPEDFPFRVVGTSHGEDEHILEAQAQQEQDSAILQSVFEQNVNLLNSLDKNTGSAA